MHRRRVAHRWTGAVVAGALMATTAWTATVPAAARPSTAVANATTSATTDIVVDGADIPKDNVNGLTFKGFGVLTANSTSAVLMDYKAVQPERYAELLGVLFGGTDPLMNHVKIEMGNDRNTSTGPDPATKRTADEPANVRRAPGFQLAADAKKLNPNLRVSILRWVAPAWADTNDKVYDWYKETILTAYREYGYMVDYVNPGVNEHAADLVWTKEFAQRVRSDVDGFESATERELFNAIRVVISDEVGTGTFGPAMTSDAELRDAVSVAGFHYNTDDDAAGSFTRLADELDVEVWNSEAQATFSDSTFRPNNNVADPTVVGTGLGGTGSSLEMANTIVKGFVKSRRTHFVYQPAIGSFFEGGQYSAKELVGARDPWSGFLRYDAGLAVLEHFSSFARTGWENDTNTAGVWRFVPQASTSTATGTNPVNGRNGLANHVTIAAPDGSDFSTVVVNDSEKPQQVRITPTNLGLAPGAELAVWETRAADSGQATDARYKQHVRDIQADESGAYTLTVAPFSIATVTSLSPDELGATWTTPLPERGERTVLDADPAGGTLWRDDFNYADRRVAVVAPGGGLSGATEDFTHSRGGDTGATPLYTWDRNGAFEVVRDGGATVLRQQVDRATTGVGGAWNGGDPITAVGERRWTNYRATVDARFPRDPAADNYALLGVRSSGGSASNSLSGTPYALRVTSQGTWSLLRFGTVLQQGTLTAFDPSAWHELSVQAAGATITAWVDGDQVAQHTDPTPLLSGWVDLGSGFHHTEFDNLTVERVAGYTPYYSEHLDDLEMHSATDTADRRLTYAGSWSHANGLDMYQYQRSRSTSRSAGATLTHTFVGTGLDVVGPNDGSARVDVRVDGELVLRNAPTFASGNYGQTFALRGLPQGTRTVELTVVSGTLVVDSVGIVSETPASAPSTVALAAAVADAEQVERDDEFTDESWATLQRVLTGTRAALADPQGYGLDAEGAEQLVRRLTAASAPLAGEATLPAVRLAAYAEGPAPQLPAELAATLSDGSTRTVPVTWDPVSLSALTPWSTVRVTGRYGTATTTATIDVVPGDTVAFADVNGTAATLGRVSPAWTAVADLVGEDLVNDAPDQVLDGSATWGHDARNAAGARSTSYKGVVAGDYDKTSTTGLYTANQVGATVSYTVPLPAGRYTVAAGTHSWWPENARSADVVLTYDGADHVVDTVTLNSATRSRLLTYEVELAADGPVRLSLRATNAQSPMLSWFGAARIAPQTPVEPAVTSIAVTREPTRTTYTVGDAIDLAGLEVTATFDDGTRRVLDASSFTVSGYDAAVVGTQTVTVRHAPAGGPALTATFRVTVRAKDVPPPTEPPAPTPTPSVVKLSVSASRAKIAYGSKVHLTVRAVGTAASPSGTVTVYDGNRKIASGRLAGTGRTAAAKIALPRTLAVGKHTLTVRYPGTSTTRPATSRALRLTVVKARPAVKVTASGKKIVIRASAPGMARKPLATVWVDGKKRASVRLKDGRAVVSLAKVRAGKHTARVKIAGNARVETRTVTIKVKVSKSGRVVVR